MPSFKNTKSIYRNRETGKPFIGTAKRKKEWMDETIASFASQLRSAALIACGETSTVQQRQSWIASFAPLDDARQIICELHVNALEVSREQEGADITITLIDA